MPGRKAARRGYGEDAIYFAAAKNRYAGSVSIGYGADGNRIRPPQGRTGRLSESFTLDQAKTLLAAAKGTCLHAYMVLSLLVGIRTEEARALRWDHLVTWVDDDAGVAASHHHRIRAFRRRRGLRRLRLALGPAGR